MNQPNVRLTYPMNLRKDQVVTLGKRVARGFGFPGGSVEVKHTWHQSAGALEWEVTFRGLYFTVSVDPNSTTIVCYPVVSPSDTDLDPWAIARAVQAEMLRAHTIVGTSEEYRGPYPRLDIPPDPPPRNPWWQRLCGWSWPDPRG